jgi:hypothetical protein
LAVIFFCHFEQGRFAPPLVVGAHGHALKSPNLLRRSCVIILSLGFAISACSPTPSSATQAPPVALVTETATPEPSQTATFTETASPTATETPTPTFTPTFVQSLRAKVIVGGRLSCRFGPGAPFLYKFSYAKGTTIELLGRMEVSHWVLTRAVGGTNRCWVNGGSQFLQIDGDLISLAPVDPHLVIAWSPYYTSGMSGVTTSRDRNTVTVRYNGLVLRAGDDSEQTPYLLEAWVCQNGEFIFTTEGSYSFAIEVQDEPGCSQPSHGRVAAAEKHGYTPFVEVEWPDYQ